MHLIVPTFVDCTGDALKVGIGDTANEKHLNIVFNCNKFRVIDPGLSCERLSFGVNLEWYWLKTQLGFTPQKFGPLPCCMNNTVLTRPDTSFAATSSIVGQYGPVLLVTFLGFDTG